MAQQDSGTRLSNDLVISSLPACQSRKAETSEFNFTSLSTFQACLISLTLSGVIWISICIILLG